MLLLITEAPHNSQGYPAFYFVLKTNDYEKRESNHQIR